MTFCLFQADAQKLGEKYEEMAAAIHEQGLNLEAIKAQRCAPGFMSKGALVRFFVKIQPAESSTAVRAWFFEQE